MSNLTNEAKAEAYVAVHFASAPTEWIAGEIARIATVIAETGQHVGYRTALINAYVAVLAERGSVALVA